MTCYVCSRVPRRVHECARVVYREDPRLEASSGVHQTPSVPVTVGGVSFRPLFSVIL